MLRKITIALCSLAIAVATLVAPGVPAAQAQQDPGLRLISEFLVPGSNDVKFPHVVAGNNLVHVTGNADRSSAYAWTKGATANSFPNRVELGPAEGQPDFSSTAVAQAPDGSVYVAWVNQPSRTVYLRQRNPAGAWGPARTVDNSSPFPVSPEVAVTSTGQVFVAWRVPDRPVRYRFSSDGGVNWSSVRNVGDQVAYNSPLGLAGGRNGSVAVTFTAGEGERLQIFVGLWNGGAFDVQRITNLSGDYADSTVSISPDGKVYVAWRGVAESGGNSGVFYAERAPDGSWPRSRLADGTVTGTASVNADENGNLHFTWLARPGGGNQIFYAFKPAVDVPRGPIASDARGALFNTRGFGSIAAGAYNHAVTEEFTGSGLRTRYSLFAANVVTFGGEPVIENDATSTFRSGDNAVLVTFRNLAGSPDQLRYAWNRVPNDNDPWVPFEPTMRIPVPESLYSSITCEISTLYTQLRNTATNQIEAQPRSDTVQIDGVVEAAVVVDNAFNQPAGTAQINNVEGAPGGDPDYARFPMVYLRVVSLTDCNGLTSLGVGPSPGTVETAYALSEAGFSGLVPMPNLADLRAGVEIPYYIHVSDGAGNVAIYGYTLTIDEDRPVLSEDYRTSGLYGAAASSLGDIMQDLSFTNLNVRDATYRDPEDPDPNRQVWGFWIANSPEPVGNPIADLTWFVVKAPPSVAVANGSGGTDYRITLRNWSLAAGLSREQLRAGEFYIYVRFLDGAGNPNDEEPLVIRVESQLQRPNTTVPMLLR